jgi:type I restriction enzyme S subunit
MICEDKLHYEKFSDGSVVCIEDEIPFKIPKNWAWCRLKNIASNSANAFVDGPFGSNLKVEHYTENREVRLIQLNNIGDGFWRDEGKKYTTFKHAEELQRCRTFPDDIVIAKMMPAGRCIIVPQIEKQYIISSDCVKLSTQIYISKNYD